MEVKNFLKEPKITIIITFYNLAEFIEDCVKSVMAQTYQNFEVMIVNDCSDEKNSEVLEKFKDEKIKIINLKENKGQLGAFLEGLKIAQGEFICMVDADDVLLPNYLKTLLYVHLNSNVALVSSSKGEINEKGEVTFLNSKLNSKTPKKISYKEIEDLFKVKEDFEVFPVKAAFGLWSWNPSTSAMMRKSALDIIKYYPDISYWRAGADKVIFSFLDLVGSSINIDAVCFLYRTHSNNSFNTSLNAGAKKYLKEDCIEKLINWNKKLRFDAIKMFYLNKRELVEKYNKINYIKMFLRVIFCIDIKMCAKILKTFAHKLIRI